MTEHELCNRLIAQAAESGWVAYPETSGWDILLVLNELQIGVQAKLHANLQVLLQCLDHGGHYNDHPRFDMYTKSGPHFRAVAVPGSRASFAFHRICGRLGFLLFGVADRTEYSSGLDVFRNPQLHTDFLWRTEKPCWIPDVIPSTPAGVPSPSNISRWKENALRLFARLKIRGHVTSRDAKDLGLNIQTFYPRWLQVSGKIGRLTTYTRNPRCGNAPDEMHPEEFKFYLEKESHV